MPLFNPGGNPNAITSAAVIPDNKIIRGDGGIRGAQDSLPEITDVGDIVPPVTNTLNLGASNARFAEARAHHVIAVNDEDGVVNVGAQPSFLCGYLTIGSSYPTRQIVESLGNGSSAIGNVKQGGYGDYGYAKVRSSGKGSLAIGYAYNYGYEYGSALISSDGIGSFACGAVNSYYNGASQSSIESYGPGSIAMGYAGGYHSNKANIKTTGRGSLAGGYCAGGYVNTQGDGSLSFGYTAGNRIIQTLGKGNVAIGASNASDIKASGLSNCMQFGEGTNALANSFQFGTAGLRLNFRVGAPGAPQNGDFWIDGAGNVIVRSGGINQNLTNTP